MVFGCGLVRLGFMNMAFAYVFDKTEGKLSEWSSRQLFDRHLFLDSKPLGHSRFTKGSLRIDTIRSASEHVMEFDLGGALPRRGRIAIHTAGNDILALATPVANVGFTYAQKTAGMPVQGEVIWDGQQYDISPESAGCYHDWTAGFLRRETFWNWACAAGVLEDGRTCCLNLAAGVNETGCAENGIWLAGRFYPLGLSAFDYDRDRPDSTAWRIVTDDNAVDVTFTPRGAKTEHVNAGLLASQFTQCFGAFNGRVKTACGQTIQLREMGGWCEDHYAKW